MAYDPYGLYRAAPHPASVYSSASYAAAAYSHYGGSYPTHAHSNPYAQAGAYSGAYGQPTAVVPPMTPGIPLGSTGGRTAAESAASKAYEANKLLSKDTSATSKFTADDLSGVASAPPELDCFQTGYKAGCQAAIQQFRVVLQTMCLPQAEIRSLMSKIPTTPATSEATGNDKHK
ncbi:uncharacterized protein LOC134841096 [Symsagittifera roscoffensis]|uniref:uncharacterized protein LOC134841096 n=1 Tax=Symsagittifera roscoffensis TaxID=84072 RepID=UPI00307C2C46